MNTLTVQTSHAVATALWAWLQGAGPYHTAEEEDAHPTLGAGQV